MKNPVLKRENLNPKKLLKSDYINDTDFTQQQQDTSEAGGYDSNEMLLETEKDFINAAKRNDVKGMKLFGRGINVNAINVHGRTALHYAVAFKNVEAVDMLLRSRAKLDLPDKHGLEACRS